MRGKHAQTVKLNDQPKLKLTRRGEWFLAIVSLLLVLFALALAGGIEQGTIG